MSALGAAWEGTWGWQAQENEARGNRARRAQGIQFREYEVGENSIGNGTGSEYSKRLKTRRRTRLI